MEPSKNKLNTRLKCYVILNLLKAGLDVLTARFRMKLVTHLFLIYVHLRPSGLIGDLR